MSRIGKKKSCYILEKEHIESHTDDKNEGVKLVYIIVKEDPNEERYEE